MNFLGQWRSAAPPAPDVSARASHGLAQFFADLADRSHPSVLSLGAVWHSTVALLTEAGAKVYTEDPWEALTGGESSVLASVQRFLGSNLQYVPESLDGILGWDLFDYLPDELLEPTRARLQAALKPTGVLFLLFRNRLEGEGLNRYRLGNRNSFIVMPTDVDLQPRRVFQNRAILDLFAGFSSSRTFVGRDNLREVLLVK